MHHRRPPVRRRARHALLLGAAGLAALAAAPAATPALERGLAEAEVVRGLTGPTAMAPLPDGRILVAEQRGTLRVVRGGALLPEPALTLPVDPRGERGLIGVAADPGFPARPYVYVNRTVAGPPARNVVSRFTLDGDVADPASERVVVELDPLEAPLHNGGAIAFGADGMLYVATGENSRPELAQRLDNRLGKMLRLTPDGGIPDDNPFAAVAAGPNRAIVALGLRNPFTFAVHPRTGRILVNDVGQASWEEVNELVPGADYGWPRSEGPTTTPGETGPLLAYSSADPLLADCAITGGAFYDPPTPSFPPAFAGSYLYADFCANWIRRLDPDTGASTEWGTGLVRGIVGLAVEPGGDVLYLTRGTASGTPDGGRLMRIVNTLAPTIAAQPEDAVVNPGEPAVFAVRADGAGPLTYAWRRDGVDLPGETGPVLRIADPALADDGARVSVRVAGPDGTAVSREALLRVTTDLPPVPAITAPAPGATYAAGDEIAFAGGATDPEDGALPASALSWRVDFHHDDHSHPFVPETPGTAAGTFTVPAVGETSANVWYRVVLTVRDALGRRRTATADVRPRTARVTLATEPAGMRVLLDGAPVTTPLTFTGVVGVHRTLAPVTPQPFGGGLWGFAGWSDGGPAERVLVTPAADATLTARFAESLPTEAGGRLVLEAEEPSSVTTPGAAAWTAVAGPEGAGGTAMRALPDAGRAVPPSRADEAPRMRYRARFATAGTYRVWVRAAAPGRGGTTVTVGLDGVPAGVLAVPSADSWDWTRTGPDGGEAVVRVDAPGVHTVDVWMAEDGLALDRLMVADVALGPPKGAGPPASPRA
jgi:glucose/arabinose dehydrogenase